MPSEPEKNLSQCSGVWVAEILFIYFSLALMEWFHAVPPVPVLAVCVSSGSVSCHGLQVAPLVPGGVQRGLWPLHAWLWHTSAHPLECWLPCCPLLTPAPSSALQIEALMMEMQSPDTGIKTQTQTVTITSIPHAVTGKSFPGGRDWAQFSRENLCVGPLARAASAWLRAGALFPINTSCTSFEMYLLP